MRYISIIPARSGSKRVPKKNIAKIAGEPALGITIRKLLSFNIFDIVYVSTDSEEIATIAENYGATAFPLRGAELSDDVTPSEVVIRNVIIEQNLNLSNNLVCCVYPLSILIRKQYLDEAISLSANNNDRFIISGSRFETNPLRHSFTINNGCVNVVNPIYNSVRSQEVPDCYFDVGMFYVARAKVWLDPSKYWYENNASIVNIPSEHAIDVDTLSDLKKLETLYLSQNYLA